MHHIGQMGNPILAVLRYFSAYSATTTSTRSGKKPDTTVTVSFCTGNIGHRLMARTTMSLISNSETSLVTVIVPAYNAQGTIAHTLQSACGQTYRSLEIIVVDDGSTDDTAAIAREFARHDARVLLVQQPNGGVAAARNRALSLAQGKYIAPLDADDLWHPTKIAKQVARFQERPHAGVVYTWSRVINAVGRIKTAKLALHIERDTYRSLLVVNFIGGGSVPLIPADILREVGGYDPTLRNMRAGGCEDAKMQLLIAEKYEFSLVPEFLTGYRASPNQMSANVAEMLKSRQLVFREALERHPNIPSHLCRQSTAAAARLAGRRLVKAGRYLEGAQRIAYGSIMDVSGTWEDYSELINHALVRWLSSSRNETVPGRALPNSGRGTGPRLVRQKTVDDCVGMDFFEADPLSYSKLGPGRRIGRALSELEASFFPPI
jgi:glycosyltransferase involved in cell wall biosynthesis